MHHHCDCVTLQIELNNKIEPVKDFLEKQSLCQFDNIKICIFRNGVSWTNGNLYSMLSLIKHSLIEVWIRNRLRNVNKESTH